MTSPEPRTTARRAPGGFPVVGIVGGGQLARMCAGPAAELGITLSVLSESPAAAAALVVPHAPVGDHTDVETVRAWARGCDVVTFDHEHVPLEVLAALVSDGVAVHPGPEALRHAQDKLVMREALTALGLPCPRWTRARDLATVDAFAAQVGDVGGHVDGQAVGPRLHHVVAEIAAAEGALEAVATALENLRTQGRMVGIVTHVESLSERLPSRLLVSKSMAGSNVVRVDS